MFKEKKLPTLLGLFSIVSLLAGITLVLKVSQKIFPEEITPPVKVKITNIRNNSFSVSWLTSEKKIKGKIVFGENPALNTNEALDDRDQVAGKSSLYFTHHVTVSFLKPETRYFFKIVSGKKIYDENGKPFSLTTAPAMVPPPSALPAFGSVLKKDGTPVRDAIVYLTVGDSSLLSAPVKPSGNFLLPKNQARNKTLSAYADINLGTKEEIVIESEGETTKITAEVGKDSPFPQITLGENRDFRTLTYETPRISSAPLISPQAIVSLERRFGFSSLLVPRAVGVATVGASLIFPSENAVVPDQTPLFKGTGIPGRLITVMINSSEPIIATVIVGENGFWTFQPVNPLSSGEHTVKIAATNPAGGAETIVRRFTILAAEPSVILTPTLTSTPTPTSAIGAGISPTPILTAAPTPTTIPILTPTPFRSALTPTVSVPKAGVLTPTVVFSVSGFFLVLSGLFLLFAF